MPASTLVFEPRHLVAADTLRALDGVLTAVANRKDDPIHEVSRRLRAELRAALRGRTVADTHALAQLCTTTLDALAARASIDDRGRYVIEPTDAELDDEHGGIQIISELNTLRAYLSRVAKAEAKTHPLGALVRHHQAAIDLIGSLRASMENLGFYDPQEPNVNGGDTVDMLTQLAGRITDVLNDGVAHAGEQHVGADADVKGASTSSLDPQTFETQRTWVLSSDHIPYDLYKQLQRDACDAGSPCYADFVAVASSPYLVRIAVHGNEDGDGRETPHESLTHLIEIARTHGFSDVVFDRDGPLVPGLPYIGHGVPETCLEAKASTPGMGA